MTVATTNGFIDEIKRWLDMLPPSFSPSYRAIFSAVKKLESHIGKLALGTVGWRTEGDVPNVPKYVLIAAPHTSNWDLILMLLCGMVFDVWPSWAGKHTLFTSPLGPLLRSLGGIPIDRRAAHNMVDQLAAMFSERQELVLAVPPEGTRGLAPHWKSGFYYIALTAGVPICLGYLDFGRKRGGLGPLIYPTGDVRADMDKIRAFYKDMRGRYPEKQGPIRLAAEDNDSVSHAK